MKLFEVLNIYANSIEEATLAQVVTRINKHKETSKSPEELSRFISADNAIRTSIDVQSATPEERKKYAELIKDPKVSDAIKNLPSGLKTSFDRLSKLEQPEQTTAPKEIKVDAVSQLDDRAKKALSQMQGQWFDAKTAEDKRALVDLWTKNPVRARMYSFGLKQGFFAMPKVA